MDIMQILPDIAAARCDRGWKPNETELIQCFGSPVLMGNTINKRQNRIDDFE